MENQNIEEKTAIAEVKATAIAPITPTEQVLTPIVESQKALAIAWAARDESLCHIDKKTFFTAVQNEYSDSDEWDETTWQQVLTDLTTLADWVKGAK